jgi:hypothetical protein
MLMAIAGRPISSRMSLEASVSTFMNATETGADNRGEYEIEMEGASLAGGIRLMSDPFWSGLRAYGGIGGLYGQVRMKLEESFYEVKPAGQESTRFNAWGWYANLGFTAVLNEQLDLHLLYSFQVRPNALETFAGERDVRLHSATLGISRPF